MKKTFTIIIHKAEEGGYWAECATLKGCFTQGETISEIKKNMKEAIECYLEGEVLEQEDVFTDVITLEVSHA